MSVIWTMLHSWENFLWLPPEVSWCVQQIWNTCFESS